MRIEPIYLGDLRYSSDVSRYIWIAPHWGEQSVLGGNSTPQPVQLRVTICGHLPEGTGNTNVDGGAPTYRIKAPSVSNTWQVMPGGDILLHNDTAKAFSLRPFNGYQYAFIIVEGSRGASVRGLYQVSEGERFVTWSGLLSDIPLLSI
jgi:hypothetical protein